MSAGQTIRSQMYYCIAVMLVIVFLLAGNGIHGVRQYRQLTKNIRARSNELPLSSELSLEVSQLHDALLGIEQSDTFMPNSAPLLIARHDNFKAQLRQVEDALARYRAEVESSQVTDPRMGDNKLELKIIEDLEKILGRIKRAQDQTDFFAADVWIRDLRPDLQELHQKLFDLPKSVKGRMDGFAEAARADYHTWMTLSIVFTTASIALIIFLFHKLNTWFLKPLKLLVEGSRKVAQGDFDHRIKLNSRDEVAELASAMNDMTRHFCEIRDDLDRQVRERSNEVVRNEQLASVGFLAAGVAHEINNPLASIAWSAESLESRLIDWLQDLNIQQDDPRHEDAGVILKYMRRIQEEAFRVKGITDGLLDFARLGNATKTDTDLRELVEHVVDMVRHLSKYRSKQIAIHAPPSLHADVCPQSMKQVVLNLITNALDSVDANGQVDVHLVDTTAEVQIRIADNGCGMTPDVLNHVFEPFFTNKRDQQGTGLGLSISHRIVTDHQGSIVATSPGPGLGSEFCVKLPQSNHVKANEKRLQAA